MKLFKLRTLRGKIINTNIFKDMNTNNTPVKLFITGATGYIGGSALSKLLQTSQKGKYDITVLTRSETTVPKFKELGVNVLIGDLDSADLLTQAAIDSDAVLHFAHADHLPAVKAFIKGLNTNDGKRRIFIHTSGTSVLADRAMGAYASETIYNDTDIETIHALPLTQPHKDVDSYIFENNQNFDSIIVAPPTIYGLGTGPFNRHSGQVPGLTRAFIKAGKAGTVGKGLNKWSNVHIDDFTNFSAFLLEKALEGNASVGYNGWYFCRTGEHVWRDINLKIAEELHKHKAIISPDVVEFTNEEIDSFIGHLAWHAFGSNSRSRSDRALQLGWKPNEHNPNIFETIAEEVKTILEEAHKKTN